MLPGSLDRWLPALDAAAVKLQDVLRDEVTDNCRSKAERPPDAFVMDTRKPARPRAHGIAGASGAVRSRRTTPGGPSFWNVFWRVPDRHLGAPPCPSVGTLWGRRPRTPGPRGSLRPVDMRTTSTRTLSVPWDATPLVAGSAAIAGTGSM